MMTALLTVEEAPDVMAASLIDMDTMDQACSIGFHFAVCS